MCSDQGSREGTRQIFYITPEGDCPYLGGLQERKLITRLEEPTAEEAYSQLSRAGFRRSGSFAYRPMCESCTACIPVRIRVDSFRKSRSFRRILNQNRDLSTVSPPLVATREQYLLFSRYITTRHAGGIMSTMTFEEYQVMVENSPIRTSLIEFRDREEALLAAVLTDWLDEGPSAVYSFFDVDRQRRSLGTYCILWLVEEALRRGQPHVYLGYWIPCCPKMSYKARFQPLEGLGPLGWVPIEILEEHLEAFCP